MSDSPSAPRPSWRRAWSRLPRIESVLLLVGLGANSLGKHFLVRGWGDAHPLLAMAFVSLEDVAFFAAAFVLFKALRICCPTYLATRLCIVLATLIAAWSAANMAWLIGTGVQLHWRVLAHLFADPKEFGPIVTNALVNRPAISTPLFAAVLAAMIIVMVRLIRPEPVRRVARNGRMRIALILLIVIASSFAGAQVTQSAPSVNPRWSVLAYNSHWVAIQSLLRGDQSGADSDGPGSRYVARIGERQIKPPAPPHAKPHVVMVIMESTARWATSLGGQLREQTPTLSDLSERGIEFETTHAMVTHTTQSLFSLFTGVPPSLDGNFVEAALTRRPYESLATILRASGYRTRFSQMVRATFECRPGLVANLSFESFWAREDLGDPSTHLGYFAGDDVKMLDPAFAWFDQQTDPCLMVFLTSVSHHPYEAPAWYGPALEDPEAAFLQTVRYTDDFIRQIVDQLKRRGAYDDTVLCVLADHGEGFGDHDVLQHGENPYEEATRVPWIIGWPNGIREPKKVKERRCLIDVTPTLLSLMGYDVSAAAFEGHNALLPDSVDRRLPTFGWGAHTPSAFMQGSEKTIYWPDLHKAYRYDLRTDPNENAPELLPEEDADEIQAERDRWSERCRIAFDAKRYHEQCVFGRWQTSCLGNAAWCYYDPRTPSSKP